MEPTQIKKRDGTIIAFQPQKIASAVGKALQAVGEAGIEQAEAIARDVIAQLARRCAMELPTIELVQDLVEETLFQRGLPRTAKAYILYRQRHTELRQAKRLLGVKDNLKLTANASYVLRKRYLRKDGQGQVSETSEELFRRVARAIAAAEARYGSPARQAEIEQSFYDMMVALDFLPNSPTLMNAGTEMGQLSACFVLPVEDSIPGIFTAVEKMALVHQSGGGTGFSFSRLRPKGDLVKSTMGIASGPVSFMKIFDVTTEVIKQGGRRRGANMAVLRCDHPDVLEFVTAKEQESALTNFNLSVGLTAEFWEALEAGKPFALRNPRTGAEVRTVPARELFQQIVAQAWRTGDPGLLFLDTIAKGNTLPEQGPLEATNPCGEQPLLPWESCNLGSLNLKNMVSSQRAVDWERLGRTVDLAVRFLDDVIDVNRWPLAESQQVTSTNRKIGLGVMGLADALIRLGLPYNSEAALEQADRLAAFIQQRAQQASAALAVERGSFPNYAGSAWQEQGLTMRNATTTTVAPTGTISIIASCSSGIEPLFAISFVRNVLDGSRLLEVNPLFEETARADGFYSEELMQKIAREGSIQRLAEIPEPVRQLFVTAFDITPQWHVRMQAVWQKHCDNAVSKTINFPESATMADVEAAYRLAYTLGCKGITVYRYGCKATQVLYLGQDERLRLSDRPDVTTVDAEYAGGCPTESCLV